MVWHGLVRHGEASYGEASCGTKDLRKVIIHGIRMENKFIQS